MPSPSFQFIERTCRSFGNQALKAIKNPQRPAHSQKSRKLGCHLPVFKPLDGSHPNPGLFGDLGLHDILLKPKHGQPASNLAEKRLIRQVMINFHYTSNVAFI